MIPTPESWARARMLSSLFGDACQRGYLDYLELTEDIRKIGEVEHDPHLDELRQRHDISGLQTIVFAGMCFEAAIYDFAAIHLGDKYVQDHLDKLNVLSKWVIVLRFVCGHELAKDRAPYASLKRVVTSRNRLVHSKSEPFEFAKIEFQLERLHKENDEHDRDVHNAFRALVLMSFEVEGIMSSSGNPLPSFNPKISLLLEIPSKLKPIVEECRVIVRRSAGG